MKKKVLIGSIILVVLILVILITTWNIKPKGYKIIYHYIENGSSQIPGSIELETFYVKNDDHVIYFYKYYFDSSENLKKYSDYLTKSLNVSFQKIRIGEYEGLMDEKFGIGLIFEKDNILLLCSIKDIKIDEGAVKWFLENHF